MVDVTSKPSTLREAVAEGSVTMRPSTLRLITRGTLEKGDTMALARAAGIMAAKRVGEFIPLCHSLNIGFAEVSFRPRLSQGILGITARVRSEGKTGVEMEALTAVAIAGLTIYDMAKSVDKGVVIGKIRLLEKRGGKSDFVLRAKRVTLSRRPRV